ncbi:glycosyltransferase family 4 protein [bacterium]|nr:glycosyltransferase family 4 protein [bacterium]
MELSRFKKKAGITSKYILHVGTLEPRKNIPNLLRAYEIIKRKHKWDGKLMLIGEKGWDYESIFETARTLKIYKDIIFTDYISISELPFYYCGAEIFTYSSIYEGFGMPCLEAIRCKSKIAVSDIPSLRESTNDQAIYFDPFDPVEMAEKIFKGLNKNSSSYIENPVFSNESIFNEILLSYKKLGLGY